ncbi:hypothetical protein LCGC14_1667820, partial [marine sediment metagenome]
YRNCHQYHQRSEFFADYGIYDVNITIPGNYIVGATGEKRTVVPNGDGTYTPSAGKYSTLIKNLDESYILTRKHGTVYSFNSEGKLTQIEDKNGNCTTVLYGSGGTLSSIIDSGARALTFTRNSQGRITRTEDPDGRIFTYEYDDEGNLTGFTDPSGSRTTYQYDAGHNLIVVTNTNGYSTYYEYSQYDRAIHTRQD